MMKKYGVALLLLVGSFASAQSTATADHWIVVRAGWLFDGTEKLAADQVILIKGDRIVTVSYTHLTLPTNREV